MYDVFYKVRMALDDASYRIQKAGGKRTRMDNGKIAQLYIAARDRYGWQCHVCGKQLEPTAACTTLDHVIPIGQGGTNDINNLQPACRDCNVNRGDHWVF
jgi:5-methylcytosine-specific restriction endonuclease McrA